MVLTKSFFYLAQLSFDYYSIRSDCRFLVVLLCPHMFLMAVPERFHALKIPLCGNVELNTGPTYPDLLRKVLDDEKALRDQIAELTAKTDAMITDFSRSLRSLDDAVKHSKLPWLIMLVS